MNAQTDDFFKTKDWLIASLCLAKGLRLANILREDCCWFQFEGRDRGVALAEAYFRGDLQIDARLFAESQKRIKDRIHGNY